MAGYPTDVVHLGENLVTWDDVENTFRVFSREPLAEISTAFVDTGVVDVFADSMVNNIRVDSTGERIYALHGATQSSFARLHRASSVADTIPTNHPPTCLLPYRTGPNVVIAYREPELFGFAEFMLSDDLVQDLTWDRLDLNSNEPVIDMLWADFR